MRRALLLGAAAALAILGGCSAAPAPGPAPAPDRYGAPVPGRTLDASGVADRPCGVLRAEQLEAVGLETRGQLDPLPAGRPACVWEDSAFTQQTSLALYPDRDYLVDTYRARGMYQLFEPVTVGGLPAVLQQTTPGALTCTVTTGLAVGQAADVTVSEIGVAPGTRSRSCEKATRVSEMVIGNLPAASPK